MSKEVSAGIVVFNNGKYLLLHYEAGHWDLPKGHVEKDENLKDAALRELEEETSIANVEFIDKFKEHIHYFFKRKGELVSKDVYFFLAKSKNQVVKLSEEHIAYEWLHFDKALEKLTFDTAKNVLRKAHEFLK